MVSSTQVLARGDRGHARIQIKASIKSGTFVLFVDEKMIAAWRDEDIPRESLGKGLHFVSEDAFALQISELHVSAWDGVLDNIPQREDEDGGFDGRLRFRGAQREPKKSAVEPLPAGRMALHNGDYIEGEVLRIEGEKITIKTKLLQVDMPLTRLKNLTLSKLPLGTAKQENRDIRATLIDDTQIVFRLDDVEEDAIVGFSQAYGEARFRRDAIKRIQFNLYPKNEIVPDPSDRR
jgi:hypothetical protein